MRLSEIEKEISSLIYKTLKQVNNWTKTLTISEIKKNVEAIFNQEKMDLEYFMIADEETLKEAESLSENKQYRAFIVVNVGNVRLIDNLHLD